MTKLVRSPHHGVSTSQPGELFASAPFIRGRVGAEEIARAGGHQQRLRRHWPKQVPTVESQGCGADQILFGVIRRSGREKWVAEKRNEDPLLFASHADFVSFPPDGPLRQLSIPQMRQLKESAQFKPSRGSRRVFLIDHVDRAGEQAANSLLKTLEEPPDHLILILTAENAYDLLPTIRSRASARRSST